MNSLVIVTFLTSLLSVCCQNGFESKILSKSNNVAKRFWGMPETTFNPRPHVLKPYFTGWTGELGDFYKFDDKFGSSVNNKLSPQCKEHIREYIIPNSTSNSLHCGIQAPRLLLARPRRTKRIIGGLSLAHYAHEHPSVVRLTVTFPRTPNFFSTLRLFPSIAQSHLPRPILRECTGVIVEDDKILTSLWCFMKYEGEWLRPRYTSARADAVRISVGLTIDSLCYYVNYLRVKWVGDLPKLARQVTADLIVMKLPSGQKFPLGYTEDGYGSMNEACSPFFKWDDDLTKPGKQVTVVAYGSMDQILMTGYMKEAGIVYEHNFTILEPQECNVWQKQCGPYSLRIDPDNEFCVGMSHEHTLLPFQLGAGAFVKVKSHDGKLLTFVAGIAVRNCTEHIVNDVPGRIIFAKTRNAYLKYDNWE